MRILFSILVFILFTGCWITDNAIAPAKPTSASVTALGTAAANTVKAIQVADAQTFWLHSKLKANIEAAKDANTGNPEGAPKTIVEGELTVAQSRLNDVTADPIEAASSARSRILVESGKASEARAAYAQSAKDAATLSVALAQALKTRDSAIEAEAKARSDYEVQLENNRKANQKVLDDLTKAHQKELDDINNSFTHEQARDLNIAGAACLVVLAVGIGFGGFAGAKATGIFGVLALICFGLAQIVALWWFKWAILSACVLVVGVLAYLALHYFKLTGERDEAATKASRFQEVLHKVVPALDKAYENGTAEVKTILDDTVFQPLKEKMDDKEKQTIHAVRATLASDAPAPMPA